MDGIKFFRCQLEPMTGNTANYFLIWDFYNDLCAVCYIRIFQYELPVMLLDNAACNIKPHTKMQVRSPAMVTHEKLLVCMM